MSKELNTAFIKILEMPYFKNEAARSGGAVNGHEDAVEAKFKEQGFTNFSFPSKGLKEVVNKLAEMNCNKELNSLLADMPNGSYIPQPLGSNSFPDFLVKDFDCSFKVVECKSSTKNYAPTWNDNVPKDFGIYIMTSARSNETTIFMGKQVITLEQKKLINEMFEEIDLIVKKYGIELEKVDTKKRGFYGTCRPQHWQRGKAEVTNYFTHSERKNCEDETLAFVLGDEKVSVEPPTKNLGFLRRIFRRC